MTLASANKMAEAYLGTIEKIALRMGRLAFSSEKVRDRWANESYSPSTKVLIVDRCLSVLVSQGKIAKCGRYYRLPGEFAPVEIPESVSKSDRIVVERYGALAREELLERLRRPRSMATLLQMRPLACLAVCSPSSRGNFTRALVRWLAATGAARYENGLWSTIKEEANVI